VNGLLYGRVRAVEANPASDLLVLPQGLVPLTFVVERRHRRVIIDPPEGLIEPRPAIEVVDYDPAWPRMFESEAERLRTRLGELAVRIEHVGSTSVPGLAAKPIIDIQVSVPDVHDLQSFRGPLEALGYEYVYDPDFVEYPFFGWPTSAQPRTFNVHVCQTGTEWEARHLRFRDRLRSDPVARDEYAALKRELARKHGNDIEGYVVDKDAFIRPRS
jgi:GrpB-like predicted nucleotidyltransferase (UPF0157 family)